MYNLKDKTVVITGAGGVLCSTFARKIALCGAKIALLDISLNNIENIAQEIISSGGSAIAICCNVLDFDSLNNAHKNVLSSYGKCDILINGAGGNNPRANTDREYHIDNENGNKTFFDISDKDFMSVFDLNLKGTVLPCQTFICDMIGKEDCCVLNISSMNYLKPLTKIPAYSSAKSAVTNFTQWLAVHFSKNKIRVNAIAPGFFVTEQNRKLLFDTDGNPTSRTNKILTATPLGRFGEPEELLDAVLFLIDSNKSRFITGQCLAIDGGFSIYSGV